MALAIVLLKKMHNHPLRNRIVAAFVLLTLIVSGVFSFAIFEVFHYVEEHTVSRELENKLSYYLSHAKENQRAGMQVLGVDIFSSDSTTNPIPEAYSHFKSGFTEVVEDNHAFHAYRRMINGTDYIVIQDQTNLETYERALYAGVIAGFLLSLLTAALIGWLLAKRLTIPLANLARQVSKRDLANPSSVSLAKDYGKDEIGQLARALDTSFSQLHFALQRERLFTSDVSHELRTSLMVISSASEILLKSKKPDSKDYQYIKRIKAASQEMSKLVQTFLILAREDKKESEVSEKVSLLTAANKQVEKWFGEFESKGIALILEEKSSSESLFNSTFIDTVMSNLIRNALHYTNNGIVKVTLESSRFSIEDTGIGISIEEQGLIFEPFFRGTNTSSEGMGLGLSLVHRICNHQGWRINVQSVLPTGSIFTVYLS